MRTRESCAVTFQARSSYWTTDGYECCSAKHPGVRLAKHYITLSILGRRVNPLIEPTSNWPSAHTMAAFVGDAGLPILRPGEAHVPIKALHPAFLHFSNRVRHVEDVVGVSISGDTDMAATRTLRGPVRDFLSACRRLDRVGTSDGASAPKRSPSVLETVSSLIAACTRSLGIEAFVNVLSGPVDIRREFAAPIPAPRMPQTPPCLIQIKNKHRTSGDANVQMLRVKRAELTASPQRSWCLCPPQSWLFTVGL